LQTADIFYKKNICGIFERQLSGHMKTVLINLANTSEPQDSLTEQRDP